MCRGAEPWAPSPLRLSWGAQCTWPSREELPRDPPLSPVPAGPTPHLLPELGFFSLLPLYGGVKLRTGGSWACTIPTAPANPTFFFDRKGKE